MDILKTLKGYPRNDLSKITDNCFDCHVPVIENKASLFCPRCGAKSLGVSLYENFCPDCNYSFINRVSEYIPYYSKRKGVHYGRY